MKELIYKEKLRKKTVQLQTRKKINKGIEENKLTVTIKRLL